MNVINTTAAHESYRVARSILRNHPLHEIEVIDCAFEVLAHSTDEADKALCRVVADEMWFTPKPGVVVIAITMVAVALSCVGLAMLFARLAL